jgi:hypothetical protein
VAAYQRFAEVSHEDAEKAIEMMEKEFLWGVVRRQQLNGVGVVLVILYVFALPLSLIGWSQGVIHPVLAIIVAAFSALNLLVFDRAIRTTIKYLRAPKARAIVQHYSHIGKVKLRGGEVHTFKTLLEVRPEQGTPFQDTMILPVRERSLLRMQQGTAIRVKYIPGEAGSLLFDEIEK